MTPLPPKYAHGFLWWFCREDFLEEIEGNLIEIFERQYPSNPGKAVWQFRWEVLRHFRPDFIKPVKIYHLTQMSMFRSNLKTTLRSLLKNKTYTVINSVGLAIGIAAFLLITLYARHELGYDEFHENKDNIYRVQLDRYNNGELSTQWAAGCAGIGPALQNNFPEVEMYVRLYPEEAVIQYEDLVYREEKTLYASGEFFNMFSIPLIRGIDSLVLKDPYTAVLSQSTARKYFNEEDPIGKVIKQNGKNEFLITGIYEDIPEHSHLEADILYSFETYVTFVGELVRTTCDWDGYLTYIALKSGTNAEVFESKLPQFVLREWGTELAQRNSDMVFHLLPITDIHLYSNYIGEIKVNGDGKTTYFLLIIAAFIILIAWVNYINLSTAKSMERAKEVGIRKVMGSLRWHVARQFLMESYTLNLLAIILALLLVAVSMPYFRQLTGLDLSIPFKGGFLWLTLGALFLAGGLLSGFYPAIILSGHRPGDYLKTKQSGTSGQQNVRKGLVVFQFIASLVLMVGTVTVFEQLRFMKNRDLGVNIEQTLILKGPQVTDSLYNRQYDAFKQTVRNYADFSYITSSTAIPGRQPDWNAGGIRLLEQDYSEAKQYRVLGIDGDYIDAYGLKVVAGRKFDNSRPNERGNVLFNEAGIRQLGLLPEVALDRDIDFWGDTLNIAGILENYHHESPKKAVEPLIFRYYNAVSGYYSSYYSIKMKTQNIPRALRYIEDSWQTAFPGNPFDYFFLDDYFNRQYQAELKYGRVFSLFSSLAIFIACLGLFGLASYMTKQRTKEIGIRKVLGASVSNILLLLSKDFIRLLLIAALISVPLAWYMNQQWLEGFANRITLSVWMFVLPAIALLLIALGTISFQTARSALINPVDSLRNE